MSAALLSSAPLCSISAPSVSTRFILPTHHKRLPLSSLTRYRPGLKWELLVPQLFGAPQLCTNLQPLLRVLRSIIAWNVGAGEGALCVADGEIQDKMLRSKSIDLDSYNSGDWFNRLDFSYNSNNWGVGLPPKEKNEWNWPLIKPRLADPSYKPQKSISLQLLKIFRTLCK